MSRTESDAGFERELAVSLRRAAADAPSITERAIAARLRRRTWRRAVAGGTAAAAAVAAVVLLVALIQPWQPAAAPDAPRAAVNDEHDDADSSPRSTPQETTHAHVQRDAAGAPASRGGDDHSQLIAYLSERGVLGRPLLATAVVAGEPHPVSHAFDARLDLRTVDLDALLQSLGPDPQIRIAGVDVNGG